MFTWSRYQIIVQWLKRQQTKLLDTKQHTVAASPRIQMLYNVTKNHPAHYDQSFDFTSKVVVKQQMKKHSW